MTLLQRFIDWRHERRIRRLGAACSAAAQAGNRDQARKHWQAMLEAIKARSPEQVARMEEAMGVRRA